MKTFGKKLLSMFLAMALVLGMVATMPMSAFAAEAESKVLADELEGYNRVTVTDFEKDSGERLGAEHQLGHAAKTYYVGSYYGKNYLCNGKNYLDVDVNFEGDATGSHYLRYLGDKNTSSIYRGAFTVRMMSVGDVYFVEFGYQDMDTKLNTVVPTQTLTASDYGVEGPSSDFNVKILTDIYPSAEDDTKEVVAYQFWLNDQFVCEGSFEEAAHNRMGLCSQVEKGKSITLKVPGEKQAEEEKVEVDPFEGYDRITLADYVDSLDGALKATLSHGEGKTYNGTGDLNKSYLDVDVNFNGTTGVGTANLRYQGSDRWTDSYCIAWSGATTLNFFRYKNDKKTADLKTNIVAADYGISGPSDWFNVKIKTDVTVDAQDATKQTVKVALYLNNKLAYEGTVEETRAAANRDKLFISAGSAGLSARVPMNVEKELAGYTPITLEHYGQSHGTKTDVNGYYELPFVNGAHAWATKVSNFDKTYLDVDVNFNGMTNSANLRYQGPGTWADRFRDNYVLRWKDNTTLQLFRYDKNQGTSEQFAMNIVAADYGISGPSAWFNVKIATDITVDAADDKHQTVNLQLWLNDTLAWKGTIEENRISASRTGIFAAASSGGSITLRSPISTVEEALEGYTPVTLNDYDGTMELKDGNMVSEIVAPATLQAKVTGFDKTYTDVDVNFGGKTGHGVCTLQFQASERYKDAIALWWEDATTLRIGRYNHAKNLLTFASITASDFNISAANAWFNVKIVTDIVGENTTQQTTRLQLWLNDQLAWVDTFEETRGSASRAVIGTAGTVKVRSKAILPTLEEALKGYTPVTLDEYDCNMNIRGEVSLGNGGSINALISDFNKTYLDVDMNFHGISGARGTTDIRYQSSGKWTDSYGLGWKNETTLDFFNYRNGSTLVDLNANIVAADYGISGPSDWFNVKIATEITVDSSNENKQTVKLQLWLNDKLAYMGSFQETRKSASRTGIFARTTSTNTVLLRSPRIIEDELKGYTRVTPEEMEGIGASRAEAGTAYTFGRAGRYMGGDLDKTYLDMDVQCSGGNFLLYLMSDMPGDSIWGKNRYQMTLSGTDLTILPVFAGNGQKDQEVTLGLGSVGYTAGEMFNLKIRTDMDGNTVIMQFWYNNKYVAKLTFTEPAERTASHMAVYGNASTTTVVRTPMIGVTREEVDYDLSKGAYLLTGADYFYVNGEKMPSGTALATPNDYLIERVVGGQIADSKLVVLYYLGDVNLDGSAFESGDPVWKDGHALKGIVNYGTPMKSAMKAADINNDGKVTQADFDAFVIIRGDVSKKDEVLSQYHTDAVTYEYLGGKDVMPIGGFYGPYDIGNITDGVFQLIKESGVNLITYTRANADTSENDLQRALVLAEKYGIGMFVSDNGLNVLEKDADGNVTGQTVLTSAEDLAAHMATYSNYDSFLGINVVDEPKGANDWATETNKKIEDTNYLRYNYYRDLAKAILPYTNITSYINMHGSQAVDKGTYSTYVNEIAKDVDVLSFDTYPYFEEDAYTQLTRLAAYLESLDIVRQASLDNGKPFWSYVQAGTDYRDDKTDGATTGYYTEGDTLWIVNTSLAFGAKGIQYFPLLQPEYFSYDSTSASGHDYDRNGIIGANNEPNRYYAMVQKANKQIAAIDDVLMNAKSQGVIVTGEAKRNVTTAAVGRSHTFTGILSQVNGVQYTDMLRNVTADGDGAMVGVFDYQGYDAYYVVNYDRTASQNITLNLNTEAKYRVIADAVTTTGKASDITLNIPAGAGVLVVMEEQYVGGNNVAKVGDVKYASLAEAVAAAGNGGTVTLIDNVTLTETIELKADVKLDIDSYRLSGGTIATLGAGVDLTVVSDGGSLDGKLKLAGSGATITADCDIALELNGKDATLNGTNVSITDSATDNGGVGGKLYGSFNVKNHVTENNGIRYVVLDHDTYKTANAVRVKVTKVSIRPSAAGIYYTTEVKFNENVANVGASYGVALSVTAKPMEDFMEKVDGQYTSLWTEKQAAKGADFSDIGTSCLVSDIFSAEAGEANAARGETEIFANGYVKLTVGGEEIVIMAENTTDVVYSMRTIMETMDGSVLDNDVLTATGEKVLAFYKDWKDAMASWELPNLVKAAQGAA